MPSSSKLIKLIPLIVIILSVIMALAGNLLSTEIQDIVKGFFKTYFKESYYWIALIAIIGLLIWVSFYLALYSNPSPSQADDDSRKALLTGLQERYKERLFKKMNTELQFQIQLELSYTKQGTAQEYIETYFLENYEEKSVGTFDKLFDTYLKQLKRLLIIGEPGSGKTVLLLKFAQKLLEIADRSPNFPVAIILNLSSWRNEGQSFVAWLEQNLVFAAGRSGTSKQQAKELVHPKSFPLLLLLDGLDEIPEDHRDSCLQSLDSYLEEKNAQGSIDKTFPEIIICCRREEYGLMQADAPVQASVLIQPLTLHDVNITLDTIRDGQVRGLAAERLQKIIKEKKPVTGLLTTAFFVHLALSLAKKRRYFEEINDSKTFLELYIQEEIANLVDFDRSEKIYHWLNYLATKISLSRKGIIFELVDMQPNWLQNTQRFWFVIGLEFGLIFGLVGGLLSGLVGGLLSGLIGGLLSGLVGGLGIGSRTLLGAKLLGGLFGALGVGLGIWWGMRLTGGLIGLLVGGLMGGLVIRLILDLGFYFPDEIIPGEIPVFKIPKKRAFLKTIANELTSGLIIGLALTSGLVIGLIRGPVIGLIGGLGVYLLLWLFGVLFELGAITSKRFPQTTKVYQRLMAPLLIEYFFWIFLIGLPYIITNNWLFISFLEIIIFILYSAVFSSIGKHFVLRLLLWNEGATPLNLVQFLNLVAEKTGLMEKDGGQWRFRHQLIQDVLAGKTINPSPETNTHD